MGNGKMLGRTLIVKRERREIHNERKEEENK